MTVSNQGTIINYRIGPRAQASKECIVQFAHISSIGEASKLLGRRIVCTEEENRKTGTIVALHGRKGAIRVRFKKGIPGQALGAHVQLIG